MSASSRFLSSMMLSCCGENWPIMKMINFATEMRHAHHAGLFAGASSVEAGEQKLEWMECFKKFQDLYVRVHVQICVSCAFAL